MQNPDELFGIPIFVKFMSGIKGFLNPRKSQSLKLLRLICFQKDFSIDSPRYTVVIFLYNFPCLSE